MRKSRCLLRLKHPLGYINKDGHYQVALCFKDKNGEWQRGYKPLHRIVAEQHLGRKLRSDEIVHHRDDDKLHNHPSNYLIVTPQEHGRLRRGKLRPKTSVPETEGEGIPSPFRGSGIPPRYQPKHYCDCQAA